ncbi:unnamed protein product [Rangifer tarandus platyrhynchus]|uniref:Uncharacterized protein n=2 Tax=Rangifer tarandus platyrhynchus TaxID=3082113 RepID=A0AC59ZSJ9_RANTA|nr:unnamed protein product [Rangifer tarandus platyrhynchus]
MTRTVYRPDTLRGEAQAAVGPVAQLAGAEWSLTHRLPRDRRASPSASGLPPRARRSRLLPPPEPCFLCRAAASSSSSPPQNHGSSWFLSCSSDFTVSRPRFSNFMALGRNKHMVLSY